MNELIAYINLLWNEYSGRKMFLGEVGCVFGGSCS